MPFIGSLLVAVVALGGVVYANAATMKRDHERWRKDEVLVMTMEFVALANEAIHPARRLREH